VRSLASQKRARACAGVGGFAWGWGQTVGGDGRRVGTPGRGRPCWVGGGGRVPQIVVHVVCLSRLSSEPVGKGSSPARRPGPGFSKRGSEEPRRGRRRSEAREGGRSAPAVLTAFKRLCGRVWGFACGARPPGGRGGCDARLAAAARGCVRGARGGGRGTRGVSERLEASIAEAAGPRMGPGRARGIGVVHEPVSARAVPSQNRSVVCLSSPPARSWIAGAQITDGGVAALLLT
jgi:hypothetical protein